eukprot:7382620-Prymnesium_polylepis.1
MPQAQREGEQGWRPRSAWAAPSRVRAASTAASLLACGPRRASRAGHNRPDESTPTPAAAGRAARACHSHSKAHVAFSTRRDSCAVCSSACRC